MKRFRHAHAWPGSRIGIQEYYRLESVSLSRMSILQARNDSIGKRDKAL